MSPTPPDPRPRMSRQSTDITRLKDVTLLVETFYARVKTDPLIGPVFGGILKDKWEPHLEKFVCFWQTVLLDDHTYSGSPFPPHAQPPIREQHFEAWIGLWKETIDQHFAGRKQRKQKQGVRKWPLCSFQKLNITRTAW